MSLSSRRRANMNNFDLIDAVRVRTPLWDKSTWEKMDVVAREELWNEVAAKMNTTKDIVKIRWKNLKDSYRKIIRKMTPSDRIHPKWNYFKAMSFLKDITMNVKPKSADISVEKVELQLETDYSLTLLSSPADDEENEDPLSFSGQIDQQQVQIEQHSIPSNKQKSTGRKRTADADVTSSYLDTDENNSYCENTEATISNQNVKRKTPPRASIQNDDDYQFLLSLYPHLRQVPMDRKLMLRMKIEHLIYTELYGSNSNQTSECPGNIQFD